MLVVLTLLPANIWAQTYVATVYTDATFTTPKENGSYASLNQALMNAEDGEGVRLIHNVQENIIYSKPGGTNVTLDLNNYSIMYSMSGSGYVLNIERNGGGDGVATLTIVDNAESKTTQYWRDNDYWSDPQTSTDGYHTEALATLGGCIIGGGYSSSYACVTINDNTELILNGGNVVGARGDSKGGGIYVNGGTCTIGAGARVCGNYAYQGGGGIYLYSGTLNIFGGSIDNNIARNGGGGVYHYNGTLNLSGAPKIIDNFYYTYSYPDNNTILVSNNLYLYSDYHDNVNNNVTLSADPGYLSDGASIGVTKESSYPGYSYSICFTNELDKETAISQMAYFFCDDPNYCISYDYNSYNYTAVLCLDTPKATLKNSEGTVTKGSYATVTAALAAAANGDQVILIDNVEEDVVFSKPGGTTVTLDLNDKNISHNYSNNYSRVITISKTGEAEGNATLTIVDNAEDKTPLYWAEHSSWKNWYWSNPYSDDTYAATRVTYGGCIKGGNSGGIKVNEGATLNLNGGNVVGNTDSQGSGIYIDGGTCTIGSGAKVCGNTSTSSLYDGGGIYVNGGTLTINGGNIENNHIYDGRVGGGVYVANGTLNLSGAAKITGNTSCDGTTPNNLYLASGKVATISSALTEGASIGVSMQTVGVFTSGLSGKGDVTNFTSDNSNYVVILNDNNEARLSILLTSSNVSVPDVTFNEDSQTATVKYNTNTSLTKGTDYTVDGTDALTDVGSTTFSITGTGNYTGTVSSLTFTVTPKYVTIPTAVTGLMWTGNEQTGVAGGDGYTVTNGTATDIGNYTATATLNSTTNYQWSDATTEAKEILWSIGAMLFEAGATSAWRTWYNNADMTVDTEKMETYVVTDVTSSEVTALSTDGKIYKNTPMLLKRKEGVTSAISVNASETALTPPTGLSNAYIGNVSSFANYLTGTVYVLAGSEFVRAKVTSTTTFDKSKCFIYLTPSNANNSRLYIVGDGPMGIDLIVTDGGNDIWYTIGGRKLSKQPKRAGVYISNGKKVIVK